MQGAKSYMLCVAEMPTFKKAANKIFTTEELDRLVDFIAWQPDAGVVIPGSNGARKLRWPAKSQGKRGGARVIYYFRDLNMPAYLLALYAKGEKIDLSAQELALIAKKIDELVEAQGSRLNGIIRLQESWRY
jgi:mRNA-degrading endonuclease RelE of RelBE toxin-antitoxin system